MSIQKTGLAMVASLALAAPGLALAGQSADKEAVGDDASGTVNLEGTVVDIPAPKEAAGGFKYVTGGVGDVEQANMQAMYGGYSFMLVNVLSGPDAAFVSNVHVTIKKNGEVVLETTTDGPWLIADIPPGTYHLTASFDGSTTTNTLKLYEEADQRLVIDWRA